MNATLQPFQRTRRLRRCVCCHQWEHGRGELPAGCLISDLTVHYVEGRATGPGLVVQLVHALGDPRKATPGERTSQNKPDSRPPGWRDDISDLLKDMRTKGLMSRTPGWLEANAAQEDLEQWKLQARKALGFVVPSVLLGEVACVKRVLTAGGWETIGCGQISLRVAADADSDVWCSRSECHDDERYPQCRDWESLVDMLGYDAGLGYAALPLSCRRTEKDLRHAIRWTRPEWATMFVAQQQAS
jgi:hypothetical protein